MKLLLKAIFKIAKQKGGKANLPITNRESREADFEPAPSYWALIPVQAQQPGIHPKKEG